MVRSFIFDDIFTAYYLFDDDDDRTTAEIEVPVNSGDKIPGDSTVVVTLKKGSSIPEGEVLTLNGTEISLTDDKYELKITKDSVLCVGGNAFGKLQTLLTSVKEITGDNYSDASFKALQTAIADAEKIGENATDETITDAYTALTNAKNGLKAVKSSEPELVRPLLLQRF